MGFGMRVWVPVLCLVLAGAGLTAAVPAPPQGERPASDEERRQIERFASRLVTAREVLGDIHKIHMEMFHATFLDGDCELLFSFDVALRVCTQLSREERTDYLLTLLNTMWINRQHALTLGDAETVLSDPQMGWLVRQRLPNIASVVRLGGNPIELNPEAEVYGTVRFPFALMLIRTG